MTESQLTRAVMRMIRSEFPQVWAYKTNDRFAVGIPDILICQDHLCAIELKIGDNQPTRLQQYTLDRINAAGGRGVVCRSVSEVRQFLKGGEKNG